MNSEQKNQQGDDIDKLFSELKHLPAIAICVKALAIFARSLRPSERYHLEGLRYVLRPSNFVSFTPRYTRSSHVTIELRGNPKEFSTSPGFLIKNARAGSYSKCDFTHPSQLAVASANIRKAFDNYAKGAGRARTKLVVNEERIG